MKTIKTEAPKFYEATCVKCLCTYTYQLEDIECENPLEGDVDESPFKKAFTQVYKGIGFTTCPNCNEKNPHVVVPFANGMSIGGR